MPMYICLLLLLNFYYNFVPLTLSVRTAKIREFTHYLLFNLLRVFVFRMMCSGWFQLAQLIKYLIVE